MDIETIKKPRRKRRKKLKEVFSKHVSNIKLLNNFLDYVQFKKIPEGVDQSSVRWIEYGIMDESRHYISSRVCIMQKRKGGVMFPLILFAEDRLYYGAIRRSDYIILLFKKECKKRGLKCYDFLTQEDVPGWLSIADELNKV